ncbi:unnamed protein product, partial [Pylaiella littoralis]
MSRWLGIRKSGASTAVDGTPKQTSSPRAGRRRSSEETLDGAASRHSSQQSQAGSEDVDVAISGSGGGDVSAAAGCEVGGTNNPNRDLGDGSSAFESDWEVLEDMGELKGFQADGGSCGEHERADVIERPLSPGVDFSSAYMIDKDGGVGQLERDDDS